MGVSNTTWKKILPLGFMFFCILFNYTILRDTKARKERPRPQRVFTDRVVKQKPINAVRAVNGCSDATAKFERDLTTLSWGRMVPPGARLGGSDAGEHCAYPELMCCGPN